MDRRAAKRQLRRELFSRLREMPESEKEREAESIRKQIAKHPVFRRSKTVAAFIALASEPNLDPLIEPRLDQKKWCLPRVTEEGTVEMHEVCDLGQLTVGEFKIREPEPAACPLCLGDRIDLILLPGVGFDATNHSRLGRGKGHYDRFLERLRNCPAPPVVWGVCFSNQIVEINPEAHDQPVDAIMTSQGLLES